VTALGQRKNLKRRNPKSRRNQGNQGNHKIPVKKKTKKRMMKQKPRKVKREKRVGEKRAGEKKQKTRWKLLQATSQLKGENAEEDEKSVLELFTPVWATFELW